MKISFSYKKAWFFIWQTLFTQGIIWVKFDQNLSSLMRKENEIKLFQIPTTNMILVQVTLKKGWNLNSASIKSLNRTKGFSDAMNREYHLSSQISIFFVIDMFWNINLTYVKSPLFIVIVSLYFKTDIDAKWHHFQTKEL